MQLEVFRGRDMRSVVAWVHRALGDDAMVVRTNVVERPGGRVYEVLAAPSGELEDYRRSLVVGPVSERLAAHGGDGPFVIALVGPPGVGKTTTAVKLALHPRGVGKRKIGLMTLDTYRVGAIEEMQTYAEIAGLPVEVVYHAREVESALARMSGVDVLIVDTPGRSPAEAGWSAALHQIAADEVHLVLPAGIRHDIARDTMERLGSTGITHALFSRLDEVRGDAGLASLADEVALPVRWVSEGHEIPGRLEPASRRIVRSLGLPEPGSRPYRRAG